LERSAGWGKNDSWTIGSRDVVITLTGFPASRSTGDVLDIAVKYLLRIKLDRFGIGLEKAYQINLMR
jgi:hypothetical protein